MALQHKVFFLLFVVVENFLPKKDLDQINLHYHQILNDYMDLKRELEAVKSENQQLRDLPKLYKFGFDLLKYTAHCFFYRIAVYLGLLVALQFLNKPH